MNKQLFMRLSNSTLPPKQINKGSKSAIKLDFSPLPWENYFDEKRIFEIEGRGAFNVYLKGKGVPVIYLLHGAGMSALSWANFSLHFSQLNDVCCVAFDMRGHGDTRTVNDSDLSLQTLVEDAERLLLEILCSQDSDSFVVVIGHSLGGSVAVNLALRESMEKLIKAVVVIDVVEGSTLSALSGMQQFLRNRPASFKEITDGIEYLYRSNQVRNIESVRVSGGANFKQVHEPLPLCSNCILEEDEYDESKSGTTLNSAYTWRVNLKDSEPYWDGWFRGLSRNFLEMKCAKLLLLADVSRLDKELTLAQMQGKFQVQVISNCGHVMHEDLPDVVASNINTFLIRYKLLS